MTYFGTKHFKSKLNLKFTAFSQDPGTEGFDNQAGETWIYPTNLPIREYQFKIVQEALFKNTLVCRYFLENVLSSLLIYTLLLGQFTHWFGKNLHSCRSHVQLLQMVSNGKNNFYGTNKAISKTAD